MPSPYCIERHTNPCLVGLAEIPLLSYDEFAAFLDRMMGEEGTHCVNYFVVPLEGKYRFICCMAADENHALVLFSHEQPLTGGLSLPALSARHYQLHVFEREIHESYGIAFDGHPWLKPVRYPFDRAQPEATINNYPFYSIHGDQLHGVGVGPIHAGVIEPGHFRFICNGEQVLHLEIQLGYQHRGVEQLMVGKQHPLQRAVIAESIAGDTVVGHMLAFSGAMEALSGVTPPERLSLERIVALELERIAVHIGDTAALCNDVAYQFGQVVNEALRTLVINTTQRWCGNRFGKGLLRPGGTHHPLTSSMVADILETLGAVESRYHQITDRIFTMPSLLGRFEDTGTVTTMQATLAGAVGMAARSSGMHRDIRWSHPFAAYRNTPYMPVVLQRGDVWSRAMMRAMEVDHSLEVIRALLENFTPEERQSGIAPLPEPAPSMLALSLVEGWRGEICHTAVTGPAGEIVCYKIKDPSLHNWMMLALAVRGQGISDFPLCNKSFNLSYCGHDL